LTLLFKKIKLVNFGSYQKAEVNLQNRGICAVSGENHCIKDNALSNGSGKSTIWSAICYALTGETISGLTSNLKNINIDEDDCYVSLEFSVDKDNYIITRYHKPKSDLKIIKNDVDISGKGITESKKVLEQTLPDLTKDLIASTILLGQGLPNKFSSFSPSGRKELLEKLTKSDFMIEDIRTRVADRETELNKKITDYSNSLLVNKTNLTNAENSKKNYEAELAGLKDQDYDIAITELQEKVSFIEKQLSESDSNITATEALIEDLNKIAIGLANEKAAEFTYLNEEFNSKTLSAVEDKTRLTAEIKSLTEEIKKKKSVKDTCPTCGQKLIGVEKPDTSVDEQLAESKQTELTEVIEHLNSANQKYNQYKADIENKFAQKISNNQVNISEQRARLAELKLNSNNLNTELTANRDALNKVIYCKENYEKQLAYLKSQITETEQAIKDLSTAISITGLACAEVQERLAINKKMESLIKRDFRGYLLTDIIKYIDQKAKEYCEVVFGTRELFVELNGNSLDIIYCNKAFDNLSGGEKQKCDLILQFAIRDLLQTYMGYSSNILVLDEIFDNLDKLATTKIIELIADKLKDVESIFITSHHSEELDLPVDSELKIVKSESGISEIL